jgi:hypothetical protein
MADPVEMKLLHMVTGDPKRTPTFTGFANPDYFVFAGASNCNAPCVQVVPSFAWNHGDFSPDINVTWLGMVGPGIKNLGVTSNVWSDQTDVRPTMMSLLGLHDDYRSDGRDLFEFVDDSRLPVGLRGHTHTLLELAQAYKQLNACVGQFGADTLTVSTKAIESNTPNDFQYNATMATLAALGQSRDAVANQIANLFDQLTFDGGHANDVQAKVLLGQANALLATARVLAQS